MKLLLFYDHRASEKLNRYRVWKLLFEGGGGVLHLPYTPPPKYITFKVYFKAFGSLLLIRNLDDNVNNL